MHLHLVIVPRFYLVALHRLYIARVSGSRTTLAALTIDIDIDVAYLHYYTETVSFSTKQRQFRQFHCGYLSQLGSIVNNVLHLYIIVLEVTQTSSVVREISTRINVIGDTRPGPLPR